MLTVTNPNPMTEFEEKFFNRRRRSKHTSAQICLACLYGMHHTCRHPECTCVHRRLTAEEVAGYMLRLEPSAHERGARS